MSEDFREELISISEKLGKYNSAMQESLNILSDEFLLLRDELSTLNQNLEKTKGLDEKLDEFKQTSEILHKLEQKLQTFEKIAESMSVAEALAGRMDDVKKSLDSSKERMQEAVTPLSKKMDLLFSKMEETLSPINRKIDVLADKISQQQSQLSSEMKNEQDLKGLATSIQDDLNKLNKSLDEQNNAIRSIGTSVAYLSDSDTELKKNIDGFLKLQEAERERGAQEKTELKKKGVETDSKKLDELLATMRVQMEQMQRQETLLEGLKSIPKEGPKSAASPAELAKFLEEISELKTQLQAQTKAIESLSKTMPSGNFGEVIKHADLLNQTTSSKLDSIADLTATSTKTLTGFKDQFTQLPSLMQNVSAALDALVQEMKKSQMAFRSLENKIDKSAAIATAPSQDHLENLEMINERLKGIHSKFEEPQPYENQLKLLIEELRRFEAFEQQRLQQGLEPAKFALEGFTAKVDTQLIAIKKELANVSKDLESVKSTLTQGADITAEVDFTPVLRKIDQLQSQIETLQRRSEPIGATMEPHIPLTGAQLLDQREILEEVKENLRIFDTFELSDRARIVVDRVSALVKRGLSLYSQ